MTKPKVGLMTFGDERDHEWAKVFRGMTEPLHEQAVKYFASLPIELHSFKEVARSKLGIDQQVDELKASGVEALVAHVPCWAEPNLVVRGVQRMDLPTVLISNKLPGTHGTVGLLGAGGALDQIGKPHLRIRENFDGAKAARISEQALPLFRAAAAAARLRGETFGMFGGRSLGIDTGTFDPMQWRAMFHVDTEHIDQLEIIRRAELISDEETEKMVEWLTGSVDRVDYDEKLTREKLAFQIRCYLATKEIIAEKSLNFIAVKCMPDLTNHYVPQCLSAALLPGPYDADGEKEPLAMACEADADAALTMEILKHISGGKPTMFGDVSYLKEETQTIYIPNCGGMCSWFAGRADDAAENMSCVELRPAIRPGGGCITYFTCAPGTLTLARLYRKAGEYYMAIVPGEAIELPQEEYAEFVKARGPHQLPTAFVKVNLDMDEFIDEFASNHITAVAGDYVAELVRVCELLDIVPVVMGTR